MRLIDFISDLQRLYESYDEEYKSTMGEPEIMIDVFAPLHGDDTKFRYAGLNNLIKIEKSDDGVYDVISAFSNSYKNVIKIS